jgi:hypothetical protein
MITYNLDDIIINNIIKLIIFINNIITKISLILKPNEELSLMKIEKENYKLMLKYYNEDNEKIIKLENKIIVYKNLNKNLIKKIEEFKKYIENKKDYYNNLEKELNINIDNYFNLNIELENLYYKNKHLKFLLKKSNCNNKTLLRINKKMK